MPFDDEATADQYNEECLPVLRNTMHKKAFLRLKFTAAPKPLLAFLAGQGLEEF